MKNTIKQLKLSNEEKEGQIELLKKIKNVENDKPKSSDNDNNIKNNIFNLNSNCSNKNNDRIKKIEELCLKHTYDIDNIKENNNLISQSYLDNFTRSKNTINNELNYNSDLGLQLEHNYTDSYFYPNAKESLSKNKKNDENINNENNKDDNNIKEYISRINESQPMNKFI